MSEFFQRNNLKNEVQEWSRSTPIYQALLTRYNKSDLKNLDILNIFSLSELYLCSALELLRLPDRFIIPPSGVVDTHDPENPNEILDSVGHTYGLSGDFVLCITFGQFFGNQYPNAKLKPGDRVAGYKQIAPHLITLLDNGIAVLHGSQTEIFKSLRLNYKS